MYCKFFASCQPPSFFESNHLFLAERGRGERNGCLRRRWERSILISSMESRIIRHCGIPIYILAVMNKDEVSLLDHISSLRSSHSEAGVSVVLYAGKARLETDMPNVSSTRRISAVAELIGYGYLFLCRFCPCTGRLALSRARSVSFLRCAHSFHPNVADRRRHCQ